MKMETACSFETSVNIYKIIRRHIHNPVIFIVTPVRTPYLKLLSFVDKKRDSILSIPSLKMLFVCACVRARAVGVKYELKE
jgi:hypothetical protein